jgi:hypothetical protein
MVSLQHQGVRLIHAEEKAKKEKGVEALHLLVTAKSD